MQLFIKAFLLFIASTFSAHAAPGDPWEGTWRNRTHATMWLYQDGNTVWGSSTVPYRYHAQVSPDGRSIRGTYYKKDHTQGRFELTLAADGQSFVGGHVSRSSDALPVSAMDTTSGYRIEVDYERTDYVQPGWSDGPRGFDTAFNPNDPDHVAWINFQSPYEQTVAPRIDISDLPVPAAGNGGLWQVISPISGQVGTVAMDRAANGSFVAEGQIRLPAFQAGTPLLATFVEDAANRTLDEATLQIVASGDRQNSIVNIRPDGDAAYTVETGDGFLGGDNNVLRLVLIAGSVPELAPVDVADLQDFPPGSLGYWDVFENSRPIGVVALSQESDLSIEATGAAQVPLFGNGATSSVAFSWDQDMDGTVTLTGPNGSAYTQPISVIEREGDYFVVTFAPNGTTLDDYTIGLVLRQGTIPPRDEDPVVFSNVYEIFTERVPADLGVTVYDGPSDSANVIGMFSRDATNLLMSTCDPRFGKELQAQTGEALQAELDQRFCDVASDDVRGWVNGKYLRR